MDSNRNTVGSTQWQYDSETIEQLPNGMFSVGIGNGISHDTGLSKEDILLAVSDLVPTITDGAAYVGLIGSVRCYFMRRGKAVEVGSRKDFEDLEWGALCDEIDKIYPPKADEGGSGT